MEVDKICSALEKLKVDVEQHGRVDSRTAETVTQSFYEVEGENFDRSSTERITDALSCMIKSVNCENKATVLELIADASKKESIRNSCVAAGLVSAAVQFIESDDSKVVLQALRAVGNMNYENDIARKATLEAKGVEKIIKRLECLQKAFDPNTDNKTEMTACGALLNASTDCEAVSAVAVSLKAIPLLLDFAQMSIKSNPELCRMALSAVQALVLPGSGQDSFRESHGGEVLAKVLLDSNDDDLTDAVLETLNTVLQDDYIKRELVNASGGELLADIVSRCKHEKDEESVHRMSVSADLVVLLLVEDECMKTFFSNGDGVVLKECLSWISSGVPYLEISGALAIGNFARTDENCIKLVELGVYKQLLSLLSSSARKEDAFKYQQAVFSAMRNLAMPAANKEALIASGCLDVVLPILSSQSPFVQVKVLATLRMLATGQTEVSNKVVANKPFRDAIVRYAQHSGHEGVRSEASRLLALVIKHCDNPSTMEKIMDSGGLEPLLTMVDSPHLVMQNEALISLAVLVAAITVDYCAKMRGTGFMQNLIKIIKSTETHFQTCYNALAVLEALSLRDYFKRDLEVAGLNQALDDLTSHNNENIKKRSLIMLTRIKAQKIMQDEGWL